MRFHHFFPLLLALAPVSSVLAQAPSGAAAPAAPAITGQIINEDGQPLPGATVLIKGTRQACSTNADGVFTLPTSQPAEQVRVSLLGYTEADLTVRNGAPNAVTLQLLPGTRIKHGGRHHGKVLAVGRAEE